MKVTIKDIARECGISAAAVSMALSDRETRISQKTKDLVRETAKKMQYQPNQAAVSLATRRSKKIGILINDLTNPHIASLFMALNREIEKKGYMLLCHVLGDGMEQNIILNIQNLLANDIAGIVWGKPIEEHDRAGLEKYITELNMPIITMGESGFECCGIDVVFDYEQAGYLATQHLIELGHKQIGCVAGTEKFRVTEDRIRGYKKALTEAGIPFRPELIYQGNYTLKSGRSSLSYLLGQKVTAIFSMNDEMAFGIYQSARIYGVRIPEDLSVIGCDNVPFGDTLEVPLATVNVPTEEMGRVIGESMIALIEEREKGQGSLKRTSIYYKPVLLVKGSTARHIE